jgi:hypothetical protein
VELVGGPEGGNVKVVCKISCKKSCSEITTLVSKVAYLAKDFVNAMKEVAYLAREVPIPVRPPRLRGDLIE